ncbi:MAG: DUF433 domain-containing protein [Chloroflexi bacterium]|nr:DUF433 domain-containing protein [Chloroflexota bacterium]
MAEKRVEKEIERQKPDIKEHIDGVKFHKLAKGITTHPLVRSGRPCIVGTTIMVTTIASLHNHHNMDAQQIADHLWLELEMVQDALNYYADHKQYIDVCNQISKINGRQFAEAQYGSNPDSILYRRKSVT